MADDQTYAEVVNDAEAVIHEWIEIARKTRLRLKSGALNNQLSTNSSSKVSADIIRSRGFFGYKKP